MKYYCFVRKHFLSKIQSSTVFRATQVLTPAEIRKVFFVIGIQIFLGLLDLLGIAVVGVLGALTITGASSKSPGNRVSAFLELLRLENLSVQEQAIYLGLIAAFVLVSKTIISIYFLRRITFFLSLRGAILSAKLVSKLLSQPLTNLQTRSMQQTLYAVTHGVDSITMGILSTAVQLISDGSLLIILSVGLFLVDPLVAISTFTVFALVAYALYRMLEVKSRKLGKIEGELAIANWEKTLEVLHSYRELVVRNRRSYYAREIGEIRLAQANTLAERTFLPNISKYIIELTMVLGGLAIAAVQFIFNDAAHAMAVMAVFLAASTRIAPAVLRMQQGALMIRGNLGLAEPTLELFSELKDLNPVENVSDELFTVHEGFLPNLSISNVEFTYPGGEKPALRIDKLKVGAGQVIAVVGSSGAGKTTLIDLILGVLKPQSGEILIGGLPPTEAIRRWPGSIGYVPQDVMISNGSIKSNVGLGYPEANVSAELIHEALRIAQLETFVTEVEKGLDHLVGDRGSRLSGGQRQRLGIARAMLTRPKLLVLDEATSALDGETEANISEAIQSMRGDVTVVLIAHRLSTVKEADLVLYLEAGALVAAGTFEKVREMAPNFDRQAHLMGL